MRFAAEESKPYWKRCSAAARDLFDIPELAPLVIAEPDWCCPHRSFSRLTTYALPIFMATRFGPWKVVGHSPVKAVGLATCLDCGVRFDADKRA